jgi:hypothetical protein
MGGRYNLKEDSIGKGIAINLEVHKNSQLPMS